MADCQDNLCGKFFGKDPNDQLSRKFAGKLPIGLLDPSVQKKRS